MTQVPLWHGQRHRCWVLQDDIGTGLLGSRVDPELYRVGFLANVGSVYQTKSYMRKILGIYEIEFRQQGAYPDKLRRREYSSGSPQ